MEKKLKTLEEHNLQIMKKFDDKSKLLNGIACPKCGKELYDVNPISILTSYPPKKNVACTSCDYVGYALV